MLIITEAGYEHHNAVVTKRLSECDEAVLELGGGQIRAISNGGDVLSVSSRISE